MNEISTTNRGDSHGISQFQRLLQPRQVDRFCQYLVWIFIGWCILDFLFGNQFSSPHKFELLFLSNTIFLNTVHVSFTLFLLLKYQPVKNWFHEKRIQEPSIILKWSAFFLVFFAIQWSASQFSTELNKIFQFLLICYANNHVLSQTMGLSLIINSHEIKINPHFLKNRKIKTILIFLKVKKNIKKSSFS